MGSCSWVSSLVPKKETRGVIMGRDGQQKERIHIKRREIEWREGKKTERQIPGLYRKDPLREGQLSPRLGKFGVEARV